VHDDQRPDPTDRLLTEFVQQVSDDVVPPPFTPADRRSDGGRRWPWSSRIVLTAVGAVAVAAALVALLVVDGPRSADTPPVVTGQPTHPEHPARPGPVRVRSVTLHGSFQPDQVVGDDGALWLLRRNDGSNDTNGCRFARLDPGTLAMTTYPLSVCGMNVAAGPGQLFVETEGGVPGTNDIPIHIEAISLIRHTSTVYTPVAMTVVGSEIAHTQLAYADGCCGRRPRRGVAGRRRRWWWPMVGRPPLSCRRSREPVESDGPGPVVP
jgi:hypothetical protein